MVSLFFWNPYAWNRHATRNFRGSNFGHTAAQPPASHTFAFFTSPSNARSKCKPSHHYDATSKFPTRYDMAWPLNDRSRSMLDITTAFAQSVGNLFVLCTVCGPPRQRPRSLFAHLRRTFSDQLLCQQGCHNTIKSKVRSELADEPQ